MIVKTLISIYLKLSLKLKKLVFFSTVRIWWLSSVNEETAFEKTQSELITIN
jgi:hypothetical protein